MKIIIILPEIGSVYISLDPIGILGSSELNKTYWQYATLVILVGGEGPW